jgi:hypothetical protein
MIMFVLRQVFRVLVNSYWIIRLTIHTIHPTHTDGTDVLARAIDPEVIKLRSNVSYSDSAYSEGRAGFRTELIERDQRCVFTHDPYPEAAHIIPYARGDEVGLYC